MGMASKAITLALLGTGATIVGVSALGPGGKPQQPRPAPEAYAGDAAGGPYPYADSVGTTQPTTGPAAQSLAGTPGHAGGTGPSGGTHTTYYGGGYGSPGYRYRSGYAAPRFSTSHGPGTVAPPPRPAGSPGHGSGPAPSSGSGSSVGSGSSSSSSSGSGSNSSTSSGTSRGGFGAVGHSSSSSSSSS